MRMSALRFRTDCTGRFTFARGKLARAAKRGYERHMKRFLVFLLFALSALPAAAQIDEAPKVQARLIPETDAVKPGGTLTVALEEDIRSGWHTYWSNPGDAGAPTIIQWTLPPGWRADAIQWSYPQREPVGPLMDYGYEGKPWFLVDLHVPADAAPGEIHLNAAVSWLVCREVCIPEDTTLGLAVFVDPKPSPPDAVAAEEFAAARAKLPAASPWPMRYASDGGLRLYVKAPALAGGARPVDAAFFPDEPGEIKDAAPQMLGFAKDGLLLGLQAGDRLAKLHALDGLLVLTSADKSVQALRVHAVPGAAPAMQGGAALGIWFALAFAFIGGLVLNVMPCVLPVLAMKALSLASSAERGKARGEAFAYSIGAIASFAVFGLLIVGLRAAGVAIGWGFQLQEPVVVAGLALLMFAVGLNLSGLFEVDAIAAGGALTERGGLIGAFFTGVLAVAVAAPCTAPFMATAIGYGFTQSAPIVLAVFVVLGLGFALPFLLLGLVPALRRLLPKPGTWMLRLKQILALPMYGAALWLFWVLSKQVSTNGLLAMAAAVVLVGGSLLAYGKTRQSLDGLRRAGTLIAAVGLLGAFVALIVIERDAKPDEAVTSRYAGMKAEPYSAARLGALLGARRAVFVDATASWCITCLVNEEAALSRPAVRAAFAKNHIALLIADWTNRDPQITKLLDAHGRSGVPLYLYYAPGAAEPLVLPQILTPDIVLQALATP
jgi:thiol:disulfide interchange protein/DsbC/DsbD-like thiol-disulfide interchange protein